MCFYIFFSLGEREIYILKILTLTKKLSIMNEKKNFIDKLKLQICKESCRNCENQIIFIIVTQISNINDINL